MIKIEKTDKDFQAFKWVLRAKSSNPIKLVYTCLYSDGENVVCTESHRLHMIGLTMNKVPAGLYDVVSTAKEILLIESKIDGLFPDYKQVLYKGAEKAAKLSPWIKSSNGATTLFDIMSKGFCVNPEYIKDACADCVDLQIIYHNIDNSMTPVQIFNDFGIAVIMPLEVK